MAHQGANPDVHDCLGHRELAKGIGQLFETSALPTNLLVFGSWGTGKTTFLGHLQTYLDTEKAERFQVVHFNPWEYESNPNLLWPLLKNIHDSLPPVVKADGEVTKLARSCLRAALDIGVRVASKVFSSGLIEMKLKDFEDALDKEETPIEKFRDEVRTCQTAFRDLIQRAIQGYGKRALVVVLDDLDRCLPENVIALIEGVKLYLTQAEGAPAIFVWAMDREIVSEAINAKYGLSSFTGRDYLEKIFDFQIPVPRLTRERYKDLIADLFKQSTYQSEFKTLLGDDPLQVLSHALDILPLRNPRTLYRIWSMLTVLASNAHTMIESARQLGLRQEADPAVFARKLLLGLIISYAFREWRFDILQNKDTWPTFISAVNDQLPDSQDLIKQHHNLCVVLSTNLRIEFKTTGASPNLRYMLALSQAHLEELYKLSELLQTYAC